MLIIGLLVALGVFALAFRIGGRAERESVMVMAAALLLSLGVGLVSRSDAQVPAALADVVLLGGFILLVVRHRRLWLCAELVLSVMLVVAHLTHDELLGATSGVRTFVNAVTLLSLGLLLGAALMMRRPPPGMLTLSRRRRPRAAHVR